MSESIEASTEVEVKLSEVHRLILRADFATVSPLAIQEIPANESVPSLGLVNVSAVSENPNGGHVGLCVMVVGKDSADRILWACCLMTQHEGSEPRHLLESMLVAREVIGKTTTVTIRMYGGRWPS